MQPSSHIFSPNRLLSQNLSRCIASTAIRHGTLPRSNALNSRSYGTDGSSTPSPPSKDEKPRKHTEGSILEGSILPGIRPELLTGSAKLWKEAELEELEREVDKTHLHPHRKQPLSKVQRLHTEHLQFQHPNWTGDESQEDAILRMLVDKYKPLRSGTIQTADEKLRKDAPKPRVGAPDSGADELRSELEKRLASVDIKVDGAAGYRTVESLRPPSRPSLTGSWATEPILPSSPEHRPWHTEFKPPANWTERPSIEFAKASTPAKKGVPEDPKQKRKEREELKRSMTAGRLGSAKEATLDYRLGVKGGGGERVGTSRVNPTSVKGWTSLVEDRIEKARKSGAFRTVKGRGQPLVRSTDEHNPFIAREEFLMNRIVQRNGASPPWVELQTELEASVAAWRQILLESWIRSASRNISASLYPTGTLPSLEWIQGYRNKDWETRELSYHTAAVKELNGQVRKYNGMAPYPVRRPPYSVEAERERAYRGGAEAILEALKMRGKEGKLGTGMSAGGTGGGVGAKADGEAGEGPKADGWSIGEMLRDVVARVLGAKH
ncbi:hypothetical protein D9611_013538 [Ephemerocybe angulata]|uniref:DnaJ homologue subfamily C member 28 conserved domain-containing protein n=1 Tax=Ephemerocybe angulata TaxID=980116 RepID=A0A8H5C3M8_9AGAR|nr:hypothetical protein D9611_013538 [Tulosesus angulatus]